jgi:uncharacterized protein (DUF58 family)
MVVAISMVFPLVMVRGIDIVAELPRYTERGAATSGSIVIRNNSRRRRVMIRIEPSGEGFSLEPAGLFFAVLEPGSERAAPVRFVSGRRGRCGPRAFVLSCGAPLGIFVHRKRIMSHAETLVYPRLVRISGRDLLKEYGLHDPGPVPRPLATRDPYHYTLREYSPGDSLRDIHWKLTARIGAPVVRVRERKITGRALVRIDNLKSNWPAGNEELFENMLERGLSAVHALLFDFGYTVTITGTAAAAVTVQSEAEWERVLEWFALVDLQTGVIESTYGQRRVTSSADVSMDFGATDSLHMANKEERDIMG